MNAAATSPPECQVQIDHAILPAPADVDAYLGNRRMHLACKRALDIILAAILLVVLSPVLLLTACSIRLTSPGPALFSHKRWGLNGSRFTCYKFRSMVTDHVAVMTEEQLKASHANGKLLKLKRDPRVTRIGAIIRKTSIDELPQLFNVLLGDMSLVGPRALVLNMLEPYPGFREVRCKMRPGITGLWQIRDRKNNTSAAFMIPHDVEYVTTFNLWLDLKILLLTIPAVLGGDGAY
jgi:lipopolysaccharide/colanic/teichoic acid biosynthesis glycosyltransferase